MVTTTGKRGGNVRRRDSGEQQLRRRLRTGLRSGVLLAVIGVCVAGGGVAASVERLWVLVITAAVIAADVLVFGMLDHRLRHGRLGLRGARWWMVSQFDIFAVAFVCAGWAAAGGGLVVAVVFGVLAAATAVAGWRWRARVFTAFVLPGSSRLAIALALIPALAAGAGGGGAAAGLSLGPHRAAVAVVMLVVSLYLLLFAQSFTIKIAHPEWKPAPRVHRRKPRPALADRSVPPKAEAGRRVVLTKPTDRQSTPSQHGPSPANDG